MKLGIIISFSEFTESYLSIQNGSDFLFSNCNKLMHSTLIRACISNPLTFNVAVPFHLILKI